MNEREHENLTFKEHMVILVPEASERNPSRVDEENTTQARGLMDKGVRVIWTTSGNIALADDVETDCESIGR